MSLPKLAPVTSTLGGGVNGVQGAIDPALAGTIGNINTNIVDALNGTPLSVTAFDTKGNAIAMPSSDCSVGLANAKGITIGGGQTSGMGGTGNPVAVAGDVSAIAIGNGAATATGAVNAVAFGTNAQAQIAGGVALGSGSVADRTNAPAEAFSGVQLRPTIGVVSVGAAGAERQITNVAGGSADTDAVNVRQLRSVGNSLAATLGGGASFDPSTGAYSAAAFSVAGASFNSVGGAIGALDAETQTHAAAIAALNNGSAGLVQQNQQTRILTVGGQTNGSSVSFAGSAGARQLTGVAAGTNATDAVDVGQLNTALAGLASSNPPVASENSGGAPQPVATGARSVAVGYGSVASAADTFSIGAAGAERRLVNVAAGTLSASSTDGVNGAQLYAAQQASASTASALGGGAHIDATNTFVGPNYSIRGNNYTDVGSALSAVDGSLGSEATSINNLATSISNGSIGLVRQGAANATITVGANSGGSAVDLTGTGGARQLKGVAPGTSATDAVDLEQLDLALTKIGSGAYTPVASENSGGAAQPVATGARSVAVGYGSVATAADTFSIGAAGAERRLVNVAAGALSATSTDGVNGAQLYAAQQASASTASALGGGAHVDATNTFVGPNYSIRGNNYTDVGGALSAVDGSLGSEAASINTLANSISNGRIGIVQQGVSNGTITVGANSGGSAVDFTGTGGARQLKGIAPGTSATDAVDLEQLDLALTKIGAGAYTPVASDNSAGAAQPVATGVGAVAVGYGSTAPEADTFSIGAPGAERRLVNVAAGALSATSTDGVNGAQLFATNAAVASNASAMNNGLQSVATSIGGNSAYDPATGTYSLPTFTIRGIAYNSVGAALSAVDAQLGTSGGGSGGSSVPFVGNSPNSATAPTATGNQSVAGGYQAAANGVGASALGDKSQANGSYSTSLGALSAANGIGSAAVGARSIAGDRDTTAVGDLAVAQFVGSTALGSHAQAIADPTTAVGYYAQASGNNSVAVGANTMASGDSATAIGTGAAAAGANATALGRDSSAQGSNSVAVGQLATVGGNGATAIGQNAHADQDGSVAIGNGVSTTRTSQVAIGNSQNTYTMSGLGSAASSAAQTGPTQFVSADAAGNLASSPYGPQDIASLQNQVGQLGSALDLLTQFAVQSRREARSGIASAMSMTAAPMPSAPGRTTWASNVATFRGEWASGVAVAHRLDTSAPLAVTAATSYGQAAGVGMRFGMSGEF